MSESAYDAILVVSFGGPEGPDDVLPFLENVLRGKNVPRARLLEVAEHYQHFGGISPINAQNRALIAALQRELDEHGPQLPIYWGNRNWRPYLTDVVREMAAQGVRRALAYVTSAYSSYSGCRQYREDLLRAQAAVGRAAPQIDKIRVFFNHPEFIAAAAERVAAALAQIPAADRAAAPLLFTAHSIPQAMASGCDYELQLRETCRLVCERLGREAWSLVFQSRSGPPTQPWLEPDIGDALRAVAAAGKSQWVVVSPIGFLSDHVEVLFDLDTEAQAIAAELGLRMIRAETVGQHPRFVAMIRELIQERLDPAVPRRAIGRFGPRNNACAADCCLSGRPPT
ncbi:MAG TPA: ferrochelatase [Pirellulales bacterium]|nr:ferrochelatase [Pirellulales bacterium]